MPLNKLLEHLCHQTLRYFTINGKGTSFDVIYRESSVFYVQPHASIKDKPWYPVNIKNIYKAFETDNYEGIYNPTYVREIILFLIQNRGLLKKAKEKANEEPYVLIIDEINRGNISQVFGELITLIEDDKRIDGDEALIITLPYSKETFSVPSNVYIIGTMNTADRSIDEALDTALRRRFSFKEVPPKSSLISKKGITPNKDGVVDGIDLVKLLDKINERIEKLLDKDHKIGHSYFMCVDSLDSLKNTFKDKVIPLMEEYFYGDFGKIGLVLGNSFVELESGSDNGFSFAEFEGYDSDIADDLKTKKVYKISSSDKWNFESIYDLPKE